MGIPWKLNRYKRTGGREADEGQPGLERLESAGEGEVGGGAGLTLIKIRLFKDLKKDEVRWASEGHPHRALSSGEGA